MEENPLDYLLEELDVGECFVGKVKGREEQIQAKVCRTDDFSFKGELEIDGEKLEFIFEKVEMKEKD